MNKQTWSLVGTAGLGLGVGAGLMYLLDPQGGHDRRAVARDKSVAALKKGGKVAAKTSRQLGGKTKELVSEAGSRLRNSELVGEGKDLLRKVRHQIREAVSYPLAIEAALEEGKVQLRGLVLASEVARLLTAIESLPGVGEVENHLEIHESPKDLAAFKRRAKRWAAPAARVLTGTTGSALAFAALKRRDGLGAAMGAVGLGLLAHGVGNPDVKQLAERLRSAPNGSGQTQEPARTSPPASRQPRLEDAYQPVS